MLSADVLVKPMGGLGEHVRELSTQITKKRPDACIDVITPTHGEEFAVADRVIQRFALNMMRTQLGLRRTYADILRYQSELIARAIKLPRPDIIHAHDWSSFDAARVISKHFHTPLVVTVHLSCDDLVTPTIQDSYQYLYSHIEDMQISGVIEANAVCHISQHYQLKFGRNLGVKSILCGNGIDVEPWMKEYEPMVFPGNRPKKLVYIGRLAFMKNIVTLASIDLPEDVDLCIIGGQQGSDTTAVQEVEKLVASRPGIHMMGALYGEDKIRAMKSATAGIFPSAREPFGIVGLEWMLSGVPFAASYVDGMKDYLGSDPGRGVAVYSGVSKSEIEEGVRHLLAMGEEEKKARVTAGFEIAKEFEWSKVADRVLTAYGLAEANAKPDLTEDGFAPLPNWISGPAPLF